MGPQHYSNVKVQRTGGCRSFSLGLFKAVRIFSPQEPQALEPTKKSPVTGASLFCYMAGGACRALVLERRRGQQLPKFGEECFDSDRLRKGSINGQLLLSISVGGKYNDFDVLGLRSN